jgi:hypothetical protein
LQANVADLMLGAGIGAAGEVDVEGLIQRDAFVDVRRQGQGVILGVGGRPLTSGVAGAGHQSARVVMAALPLPNSSAMWASPCHCVAAISPAGIRHRSMKLFCAQRTEERGARKSTIQQRALLPFEQTE